MQDTELALLIDGLMRRIHFALQAKAHSFDTAKVGPGGGVVLLTIAEMGNPALQDLTTRVARDKSQMTRTIRALETKGLVTRSLSPHDGRVSHVSLTEAGAQVVKELQAAVAEAISTILSPLSGSEKQVFKDLLQRALTDTVPRP